MFNGCRNMKKFDIENFDTGSARNMEAMFRLCSAAEEIPTGRFVTDRVRNMSFMFAGCANLSVIDLSCASDAHISGMEDLRNIFNGCTSLETVHLADYDSDLFYGILERINDARARQNEEIELENERHIAEFMRDNPDITEDDIERFEHYYYGD